MPKKIPMPRYLATERKGPERCEWPGCDAVALCRSGNFGDKLVCREHFTLTNGRAPEGDADVH